GIADGILPFGGLLEAREHLTHADERFLPIGGTLDLETNAIGQITFRARKQLLESLGRICRIETRRQCYDSNVEPLRECKLHPAQRRRLPRGITVEAEPHARRQSSELLQLSLGQRGSHRRDDRLDSGLAEREHIGIALDHHGALLLGYGRARKVEPVEQVTLAE